MDARLIEFANLLRQNGVRVSLSESVDTFQALDAVGLSDREVVRASLRATLVKRVVDLPTFEHLFELFFSGLSAAMEELTQATADALNLDSAALQRMIDDLRRMLQEQGVELSELARALLEADSVTLERLLREAAQQAGVSDIQQAFQEGRFSHAVATALGLGGLTDEMQRLRALLAGIASDRPELQAFLDRRLQDLSDMIKSASELTHF